MQDEELLKEICETRNISDRTKFVYRIVINQYTKQNQMSLNELIKEAETEEEERIRWKNRKIRKRLLKYRATVYTKYLKSTAKRYFSVVCTIYRHYEIEIQSLPNISDKNVNDNKPIQYTDLPDKEIIQKVLNIANMRERAVILFICSSGCGRTEVCNITVQDYIDATYEYHHTNNIYEVLHILKDQDNIIPTFELHRQKTNKHYITFCSPEAVRAINLFLAGKEKEIHNTDRLFNLNPTYMNTIFLKLNNQLNLGKKGTYSRFRPHMLRKFHASRLHNDGMSIDLVDSLQGRSKDNIHRVYFLDNPARLKKEYMNHMDSVMIEWNMNSLTYKSEEYIALERENLRKSKELNTLSSRLETIESFVFRDMSKRDVDDLEGWL